MQITGGPPIPLARLEGALSGATWGPDGAIIFGTNYLDTGLQHLAPDGGEPTVLTRPNRDGGEGDHVWPGFLPGGQAVLFTIRATTGDLDQAQIQATERSSTCQVF